MSKDVQRFLPYVEDVWSVFASSPRLFRIHNDSEWQSLNFWGASQCRDPCWCSTSQGIRCRGHWPCPHWAHVLRRTANCSHEADDLGHWWGWSTTGLGQVVGHAEGGHHWTVPNHGWQSSDGPFVGSTAAWIHPSHRGRNGIGGQSCRCAFGSREKTCCRAAGGQPHAWPSWLPIGHHLSRDLRDAGTSHFWGCSWSGAKLQEIASGRSHGATCGNSWRTEAVEGCHWEDCWCREEGARNHFHLQDWHYDRASTCSPASGPFGRNGWVLQLWHQWLDPDHLWLEPRWCWLLLARVQGQGHCGARSFCELGSWRCWWVDHHGRSAWSQHQARDEDGHLRWARRRSSLHWGLREDRPGLRELLALQSSCCTTRSSSVCSEDKGWADEAELHKGNQASGAEFWPLVI